MAQPSLRATVELTPETTRFEQGIAAATNRAVNKGLSTLGSKQVAQGFRDATTQLGRFDQQLDRTNRRVIAFGASASIIYGAVRAFKELIVSTIQVEKTLTSINSIFRLSQREMESFGRDLFSIAKQTGQSFKEVASAAEEFSRQGFDAAETAKRTRDAMILVRLSGVDTTKAVNGLTAAMATFGKTGIDTTDIINKLVTVDQQFAVSAGGLIDAFTKVGSTLDDAGVSFERFIGLVTAARQITGRSEAQIGNGLKTILTRLERSSTIDQLEGFGIAVRDASGAAKDAMGVFEALAGSYNQLTDAQRQQVAELGAGVFQINQFKALVQDLGKANGVTAQAMRTATRDTNDALARNEAQNKTLAASLNTLKASATEASAVIGNLVINPTLRGGISFTNWVAELFSKDKDATGEEVETFGSYMGERLLKGFGNLLAGPGSILLAKAVVGTIYRVGRDSMADFRSALNFTDAGVGRGLGGRAGPEVTQMTIVNSLLDQATKAEVRRYEAARTVAEQEAAILAILERQLAAQTALAMQGGRGLRGGAAWAGRARPPGAAGGYVPIGEESAAIAAGVGGAPATARPVYIPDFPRPGGQRGIVANTSEWKVPMGARGYGIYNREMIQRVGLPPGSTPVAARGFIPNAANSYNVPSVYRSPPYQPPPMVMGVPWGAPTSPAGPSSSYPPSYLPGPGGFASLLGVGATVDKISQLGAVLSQQSMARGAQEMATAAGAIRGLGTGPTNQMFANDAYGRAQIASIRERNAANVAASEAQLAMSPSIGRPVGPLARNLARRDRVGVEMDAKADALRRYGRLVQTSNRIQMGSLAGSFGAAFIPEGTSGQLSGQLSGAASSGLQAQGVGSLVGSAFGPQGTILGTAIGAFVGAVYGFVSRSQKSFEELAGEIEESNRKIGSQLENTQKVFQLDEQEAELRANGGSPRDIARVRRERTTRIASITDKELRDYVLGRGSDPNAREKINQRGQNLLDEQSRSGSLVLAGRRMTNWFGVSTKDIEGAATGVSPQLSSLSDSQITALRSLAQKDPNAALASLIKMAGLTPQQQQEMMGPRTAIGRLAGSYNAITGGTAVSTGGLGALSPLLNSLGLLGTYGQQNTNAATTQSIVKAIDDMEASGARTKKGKTSAPTMEPKDFQQIINLFNRDVMLGGIQQEAGLQVAQARQRMALSDPGLSEMERLVREGRYGGLNIKAQYGIRGAGELSAGKGRLFELLKSEKITNPAVSESLAGITDVSELRALRAGGLPGMLSQDAAPKVLDAIDELINAMDQLTEQEKAALFVNKTENELRQKQLAESRTYGYASREYAGAGRQARDALTFAFQRNDTPDKLDTLRQNADLAGLMEEYNRRAGGNPNMLDRAAGRIAPMSRAEFFGRQLGMNVREGYNTRARNAQAVRYALNDPVDSRFLSGADVEEGLMGEARNAGVRGNARESFTGAFGARMAGLKRDLMDLSQVGAQVATSLENGLGNAFGDFVTGAQKGKDAFRQFAFSVTNDAARAFATKGVQQLLGILLGSLGGAGGDWSGFQSLNFGAPPGGAAAGGPIGFAAGGRIPANVMKGEVIYGPRAARRIGSARLNAINTGTYAGGGAALVTGGSGYGDDVSTSLAPGSYVVRKAMVDRYGVGRLAGLAAGGAAVSISGVPDMGLSPTSSLVRGYAEGGATSSFTATPTTAASSGGALSINTSVTINDQRTTATSETKGGGGTLADRQMAAGLARQMEQIALKTIETQTRLGGMLRLPSLRGN